MPDTNQTPYQNQILNMAAEEMQAGAETFHRAMINLEVATDILRNIAIDIGNSHIPAILRKLGVS